MDTADVPEPSGDGGRLSRNVHGNAGVGPAGDGGGSILIARAAVELRHRQKVVILGGGIAGLVSAEELRKAGFDCTVLELANVPAAITGACARAPK